jgi:two-component system, NarL family, nitrate/nitrite response regulator NarL
MKILLADDHELYREGLAMLVSAHFGACEVRQASDFDELVSLASQQDDWSAIIVDLHMPGLDYQAGIRRLKKQFPDTPLIVITSSQDPADTRQALDAGALGYILKSMKNNEITQALELIIQQGISIHPAVKNTPVTSSNQESLTPRQEQVLALMCEGASNKRIALDMGLSESTVKIHVRAILAFFGVSNRTEAVIEARKRFLN